MPPYLYHGTSLARWPRIKVQGLKGDTPRIYEKGAGPMGYVYFCRDARGASMYALKTAELERRLHPDERKRHGVESKNNCDLEVNPLFKHNSRPQDEQGDRYFRKFVWA